MEAPLIFKVPLRATRWVVVVATEDRAEQAAHGLMDIVLSSVAEAGVEPRVRLVAQSMGDMVEAQSMEAAAVVPVVWEADWVVVVALGETIKLLPHNQEVPVQPQRKQRPKMAQMEPLGLVEIMAAVTAEVEVLAVTTLEPAEEQVVRLEVAGAEREAEMQVPLVEV